MVRMIARLKGDKVVVEDAKVSDRLNSRGYGRLVDEEFLELHPVEALYLSDERKIRVLDEEGNILGVERLFDMFSGMDERFEQKYMVYRDLRKRGYRINCFHELVDRNLDYYLKPKRKEQKEIFAIAVNEREEFRLREILYFLDSLDSLIEELWTGVVDEEGDITYYRIYDVRPKGNLDDVKGIRCKGRIMKNLIMIRDREVGKELFEQGFYGNLADNELTVSLLEAIHLMDTGVLEVYDDDRRMDKEELLRIARSHQKDFDPRYKVYKDLKERRLCVKTGYKFGTHFRAYERDPNRFHAEYLIDAVEDDFRSSWSGISRGVRLAHSVRKLYILAVASGKLRYVGIERIRP